MKELSTDISGFINVINENEIYYKRNKEKLKLDYVCIGVLGTLSAVNITNSTMEAMYKYDSNQGTFLRTLTESEKKEILSLFKYSFQITDGVSTCKVCFNDEKLKNRIKLSFHYSKAGYAYISVSISEIGLSEIFGISNEVKDKEKFEKHLNLVKISDEKWQKKYTEKGIPKLLKKFNEFFSENEKRLDTLKNGKIGFCCFDAYQMRFTYIYMYDSEDENHLKKLRSYGKDTNERFSLIQNVMKCAENSDYTSFNCNWYSVIVLKEILFNNFNFKKGRYGNEIFISFSPDIPDAMLTKENIARLKEIAIEYFGNEDDASAWLLAAELAE